MGKCERINGKDVPLPSLTMEQAKVFAELNSITFDLPYKASLNPDEVKLDEDNVVIPKLAFLREDGSPFVVFEILQPDNHMHDLSKIELYWRFNVREYWILDPELRAVTVYTMDEADVKMYDAEKRQGYVFSNAIEDFRVEISEIFNILDGDDE